MSDYGDDISEVESVASMLEEERKIEEKQKMLYKDSQDVVEKDNITTKNKYELYEKFKGAVFQNVSTDKMYILVIKKILT